MVKNEEKNLRRCLDSLKLLLQQIPSELIIIDTGSTDATVKIAREYTDRLFFHEWNNNFSEMRNKTIQYAKGEWVFIIDADEELETVEGIRTFFSKPKDKAIAAGALSVKSFSGENKERYSSILSPRIFRRIPEFRYEGVVHNTPVVNGTIIDIGDTLLHYGYLSDDKELMDEKFKRTSTLLKAELNKNPNNIYYWYQLGNSYAMYSKWQMALPYLLKSYELLKDKNEKVKKGNIFVYGTLVFVYVHNEIFDDEVIEVAEAGLVLEPTYLDLHFFLAQIYLRRENYEKALQKYNEYLLLEKNFDSIESRLNPLITHYSLQTKVEAVYNIANILMTWKNYEQARLYFNRVIKECSNERAFVEKTYEGIAKIDFEEKNFEASRKLYLELIERKEFVQAKKFEYVLENMWEKLSAEDKITYAHSFKDAPEAYGFLNRVRIEKVVFDIGFLLKRNWNELPSYYAMIWERSLKSSEVEDDILLYWGDLSESLITEYMKYLNDVFLDDFLMISNEFVKRNSLESKYQLVRMKKNILKFLIFSTHKYEEYFEDYLFIGKAYLKSLYNRYVIDNELIQDLKNVEEVFFLYLLCAENASNEQKVEYYKKAAMVFPEMAAGIKLLLRELSIVIDKENGKNSEIDKMKKTLCESICHLIELGKIDEAGRSIDEAEAIVGMDAELLALKAEVSIRRQ